jgi:hypothetical protein
VPNNFCDDAAIFHLDSKISASSWGSSISPISMHTRYELTFEYTIANNTINTEYIGCSLLREQPELVKVEKISSTSPLWEYVLIDTDVTNTGNEDVRIIRTGTNNTIYLQFNFNPGGKVRYIRSESANISNFKVVTCPDFDFRPSEPLTSTTSEPNPAVLYIVPNPFTESVLFTQNVPATSCVCMTCQAN